MHPGQQTATFSMGKGEKEGGCTESAMLILCGISQEPEQGGGNTEGKEQALCLAVKLQTEVVVPHSSSHPACDRTPTSVLV